MSEIGEKKQSVLITYFPMFIATVSLISSVYQGYLFHQSLEIVQRNVSRSESMRTCRDIITAYFQIKLKVSMLSTGNGGTTDNRDADAANAVSHFAALGTYLANFQDDATRVRYTRLSQELAKIVIVARKTPPDGIDKLFGSADELFAGMNDDCVRTANSKL